MMDIQICTAVPEHTLQEIMDLGVEMQDLMYTDGVTLHFQTDRKAAANIREYCLKRGLDVTIRTTGSNRMKSLLNRPVLLLGIGLILFLSIFLPSRILFIQVEGNRTVPVNKILETAGQKGVYFGVSRRSIRSEEVKNALLGTIPALRWVGVNTQGCVAVICVEEEPVADTSRNDSGPSSMIAATDGIILSATATTGTLLCQPGDAVSKGQVLISGYKDCGLCILSQPAQGEIMAHTRHQITAISPSNALRKQKIMDCQVNFCLILGKKRINFREGSGIYSGVCGRMYEEYYITLPGGFTLPIAIGKQTVIQYQLAEVSAPMSEEMLSRDARNHLLTYTIAGSITKESVHYQPGQNYVLLTGDYFCTEMIGRVRKEQIGEKHGESN